MSQITKSELVCLRRLRPGDQAVFEAYRNDPKVAEFQSWPDMDSNQTAGFLAHMSELDPILSPGQWSQIAVALTQDDVLIGDMGWHLSQDSTAVELGITIKQDAQRKGYGRAAMRLAIEYVFENTTVNEIICGADSRNFASLEMIKMLGFSWTHQEASPTNPTDLDEMFSMKRPVHLND